MTASVLDTTDGKGTAQMTRTTVHLLRHGEVYNPEAVLYGRMLGFRLSDDGQQMAHDAAEALRGRDIQAVIASPLQRAQETARPTAEAFGSRSAPTSG
jgi:broad specificity phosphatase PhoE